MKYLNMTQSLAIARVVHAESHGIRPEPDDVLIQLETLRDVRTRHAANGLAGAVVRTYKREY